MADKGRNSVVVGDVNGRFTEVFGKLATLHKGQNFAFAIIAGNLFAKADDDDAELEKLLDGQITVAFPTYFSLGRQALPPKVIAKLESNQGELCTNLSVLGRKVSIKTSEGFRIVSVGGQHAPTTADEPMSPYSGVYTDSDVASLAVGGECDLLITSDWPAEVQDGSKVPCYKPPQGIRSISELCTALKPRYHFSASPGYYEREPFFHAGPSPPPTTRFISLAPFGNAEKQKWVYAFKLEPAKTAQNLGPGCTASPFTSTKKRKLDSQDSSYNNFRFSNGNGNGGGHHEHNRRGKRQRQQPPPTPDQCFFCLSNPSCEAHMIASIGENAYVTIAKGPLTTKTAFPDLGFPGPFLLIPLEHTPTMSAIGEEETRHATVTEMQRYRSALQDMLVEKSKGVDGRSKYGAVCWEISRGGGVHLHWQWLPVPVDMVQKGLVEAGFDVEAENSNYPKFAKKYKEMEEVEGGDFFKVMIWSEALRKDMVMPLDGSFRFDLQFGRRVLGKLLGLEKRTHWKDCPQTKVEEEADVAVLKEAFKPFDFSLE